MSLASEVRANLVAGTWMGAANSGSYHLLFVGASRNAKARRQRIINLGEDIFIDEPGG
jgi:hypothetical protein